MRKPGWMLANLTVAIFMAASASAQMAKLSEWLQARQSGRVQRKLVPDCTLGSISIGQTVTSAIDTSDCVSSDSHYFDFYQFAGTAGQTVTATVSSADLGSMIVAFQSSGDGTVLAENQGSSPVSVTYLLPTTTTYVIGLGSVNTLTTGTYTLSLTASGSGGGGGGGGTCQTDPNTLCLLNGQYSVTASWVNTTGGSGNGTAIALTGDTGYFWFFDATNVECVVKVLDGCAIDNARWVFASGLTNVQVTLTVTDTVGGTVKTYTNPQGVAFAPIQDTAALPCP
jgi:hypothetical protein